MQLFNGKARKQVGHSVQKVFTLHPTKYHATSIQSINFVQPGSQYNAVHAMRGVKQIRAT